MRYKTMALNYHPLDLQTETGWPSRSLWRRLSEMGEICNQVTLSLFHTHFIIGGGVNGEDLDHRRSNIVPVQAIEPELASLRDKLNPHLLR